MLEADLLSPEIFDPQNLISQLSELLEQKGNLQKTDPSRDWKIGRIERKLHNVDALQRAMIDEMQLRIDKNLEEIHLEFLTMVQEAGKDEELYENVYHFIQEYLQDTLDGFLVFMQEYCEEETNLFSIISDFLEIAEQYADMFDEGESDLLWETALLQMGEMI